MLAETHVLNLTMAQKKQEKLKNLIQSSISAIINSSFDNAETNEDRQVVIEVSQDFDQYDLSDILIEKYQIINK